VAARCGHRHRPRLPGGAADAPGPQCSIIVGNEVTSASPGSVQELHLVVFDIQQARADLISRGVDVSSTRSAVFHHAGVDGRVSGPEPERRSYGSFASFGDPDGNGWLLQEVHARLPGR
jgi:hypothetical protein